MKYVMIEVTVLSYMWPHFVSPLAEMIVATFNFSL